MNNSFIEQKLEMPKRQKEFSDMGLLKSQNQRIFFVLIGGHLNKQE